MSAPEPAPAPGPAGRERRDGSGSPGGAVGLAQAEAALIEHYPRLVRLAYLVLPPSLGRHRRVLTAHALTQRALPRERSAASPVLPLQRDGSTPEDPGYAFVRQRVLSAVLRNRSPLRPAGRLLPVVVGLRLFPRTGEADELALEQALARVPAPARAAYVLRRLDGLADAAARQLLAEAGVPEPQVRDALREADTLPVTAEPVDPCALQARPTDLLRRRLWSRAAAAGAAALVLAAGTLVWLPDGWGPLGAAAPPYAENTAAEAALDPGKLRRVPEGVWRDSSRSDFSVWPARGAAAGDEDLLRRALAVWARPGGDVTVSATPGTQTGPAPGPAQLLYAGEVGPATVVLLYDGLRLVRYAERTGADGADDGAVVLDFARADGADRAGASAVVAGRDSGSTRYLTAPWVTGAEVRDLVRPDGALAPLEVREDGVTAPLRTPAGSGRQEECDRYPVLEVTAEGAERPFVLADLGELTPARLTSGAPDGQPVPASGGTARESWARTACHLPLVVAHGVRSVNAWEFAEQELPDGAGTARWVCTRAETWRGAGSRTLAQFLPPADRAGVPGALTARAEESPACGPQEPRVLSGVLWRSPDSAWYLLAAGSEEVTSIRAGGGVEGSSAGRTLALPAGEGAEAELTAGLADGGELPALGVPR